MIDINLLNSIDRSRPVIAHAAGRMAMFYIEQLGKLNISPVCFSDKDIRKHGTVVCNKEVLSVTGAMESYPDAYFYITANTNDLEKIAEDLISNYGVNRKDILNFIIHKKKINCRFISGNLNITSKFICPCCMYPNSQFKTDVRENDIDGTIADYLKQCEDALQIINSGAERDFCIDCPYLFEQYDCSFDNVRFSTINCDFDGICNFECVYCNRSNKDFNLDGAGQHKYLATILHWLEKIGAIDNTTSLGFANDEITINPFQNELFEVAENYVSEIFTNASVFSENIVRAAQNKQNFHIIVSNDSGTAETFKKVKKRDVYDKVCDNLRRYAASGVKIHLKYIFIPELNDNLTDTDGFVGICKQVVPEVVYIDKEAGLYAEGIDFSDFTTDVIRNMASKLVKMDIRIVLGNYLTVNDKKALSGL